MKIVIFSINPIFPDMVTGGASKHLYHIARHLGSKGHHLEILCAKPEGNVLSDAGGEPFLLSENVTVFPVLPFHLPFPQPYAVSGADLALIVERISMALKDADRFYIHDGELLIPDLYEDIPTTISFRDNIYPESVLGSFVGKPDAVICVSDYSADVIKHTAGRFFPGLKERIHQVNNGIDFNVFSPVDATSLAKQLGVNPTEEVILLHPHRPEMGKGLPETIQVVNRLVHNHGRTNIKVLVPEWIGSMVSSGDSDFYHSMMHLMKDLEVQDHFQFIPWLSMEQMPMLYSLGRVTLCLGNIVEAFGNVAYESLACGTPSIVARVGVHRTMLPDELIRKVHYGDIDSTVAHVMDIIDSDGSVEEGVLSFLKNKMDFEQQVAAYAKIIVECENRDEIIFDFSEIDSDQKFILAPWCYLDDGRIYHDFHGKFKHAGQLADLLKKSKTLSCSDAVYAGVSLEVWEAWIESTWIVPLVS